MSNEPKPGVIGSLPRTRPHRRSDKRPAVGAPPHEPQAQEPDMVKAAAPPKAKPVKKTVPKPRAPKAAKPTPSAGQPKPAAATPAPPREPSPGTLETAVQAAAELAEIGLQIGARALRRAISRLPRP